MWNFIHRLFGKRPDGPLPSVLAKALRHTRFDPMATRSAELMSGGFMYSDEMPAPWYFDPHHGRYAFRLLVAYRASVIRGHPVEYLKPLWVEVQRRCPHWPGFRPERSDPALREDLERELRGTCRSVLREVRRVFGKKRRMKAGRVEHDRTD